MLTLLEETRFSVVGYDEYWLFNEGTHEKKKRRLRYVSHFLSDFVLFVISYPDLYNPNFFFQI